MKNKYSIKTKIILLIPLIATVAWTAMTFHNLSYTNKFIKNVLDNQTQFVIESLGKVALEDLKIGNIVRARTIARILTRQEIFSDIAITDAGQNPILQYSVEPTLSTTTDTSHNRTEYIIKDEFGTPWGYIYYNTGAFKNRSSAIQNYLIKKLFLFALGLLLLEIALIVLITTYMLKPLDIISEEIDKISKEFKNDRVNIDKLLSIAQSEANNQFGRFTQNICNFLKQLFEYRKSNEEAKIQAAVGRLASYISHDIRTPLSVISGFMEKIPTDLSPELDEYKQAVRSSLDKMKFMIDELVDQTRIEQQLFIEQTDLIQLINKAISEINGITKGRYKIAANLPASLPAVLDTAKFSRVISNILLNATQAITTEDGKIEVSLSYDKNHVSIAIKDNGAGIPANIIDKIFDTGFTFGKRKGTGLGLAFSRQVVEMHKGTIKVESSEGLGTKFTIRIPLITEPSIKTEKALMNEQKSINVNLIEKIGSIDISKNSVLVIDDDIELCELWKDYLSTHARESYFLHSGEELMKDKTIINNVDTVIVDYKFYNSSFTGTDIIKYLNLRGLNNIYLCTGLYRDQQVLESINDLSMKGVIPKPLNY